MSDELQFIIPGWGGIKTPRFSDRVEATHYGALQLDVYFQGSEEPPVEITWELWPGALAECQVHIEEGRAFLTTHPASGGLIAYRINLLPCVIGQGHWRLKVFKNRTYMKTFQVYRHFNQ